MTLVLKSSKNLYLGLVFRLRSQISLTSKLINFANVRWDITIMWPNVSNFTGTYSIEHGSLIFGV